MPHYRPSCKDICRSPAAIAALLGCVCFSLWLQGAPADAPRVLLAPIAQLAGRLCGVRFGFAPGAGYCGWARDGTLLVIEKSCSGGNFFVILFSLLALTVLPRLRRARGLPGLLGLLGFSLLATVAASTARIAVSVALLPLRWPSPVLVHNVAGIATYLSALCLCFWLARRMIPLILSERTVDCHGR